MLFSEREYESEEKVLKKKVFISNFFLHIKFRFSLRFCHVYFVL